MKILSKRLTIVVNGLIKIPYEAIDGMYKRVTKAFRNDSNPKLKFKIPVIKNKIACGAYNQRKVFIDINEIGVDSELILISKHKGIEDFKAILLLRLLYFPNQSFSK